MRLRHRQHKDAYINNQYRCLQQFFKWLADEEKIANPMRKTKPPKVTPEPVPVFEQDEIGRILSTAEGRDFLARRDLALIRLLADTGVRLQELTDLTTDDVDLDKRRARVTGKGGALTKSGVYQMLRRRATHAGVAHVHPHRFRHDFSHRYLGNGDVEGDLMELNGWDSRQMLRHYGRSAAASRAQRHYDQVMDRCA